MAKEAKKPTAAEKGKGKATDETPKPNGKETSKDETTLPIHDKDGKAKQDGEKDAAVDGEEELSDEDRQLKEDLEMLVERLKEDDRTLYKPSIDTIKEWCRGGCWSD